MAQPGALYLAAGIPGMTRGRGGGSRGALRGWPGPAHDRPGRPMRRAGAGAWLRRGLWEGVGEGSPRVR
jgi:hypothetical protein